MFSNLPWEKSFKKFLTVLPSGEADCTLLISVFKFLSLLIQVYKTEGINNTINNLQNNRYMKNYFRNAMLDHNTNEKS